MELRDYIKIIGKNFWVLIIIVILTTGFAFVLTKNRPTTYTASTTFTVNKVSTLKQSQVNYYLYDNFYNIQSAALFAKNVSLWFSSPALVTEIYQKAGLDATNISQKALSKTFKAVYNDPSTIDVSISGPDQDQLKKLMSAADVALQAKAKEFNNDETSSYQLTKFEPIVTKNESNLTLNTAIGLFGVIILGLLTVFAIAYFKEDK